MKCQSSSLKCQVSSVKCQVSSVKCEVSNVKCQSSVVKCQVSIIKYQVSNAKCQVSCVKCQMSDVNHHSSSVKCQMPSIKSQMSIGKSRCSHEAHLRVVVVEQQDSAGRSCRHLAKVRDAVGDAGAGLDINVKSHQSLFAVCIHLQLWSVRQDHHRPALSATACFKALSGPMRAWRVVSDTMIQCSPRLLKTLLARAHDGLQNRATLCAHINASL